ncbi:hypothetical protein MKW92_011237 [Papaver armeniacum]|nr:hypothetical protein MKW92_011237 [Papaver armeniacum]
MKLRKPVLFLLFLTVLAPIVLYTDKLVSSSKNDFAEEVSSLSFGVESRQLNLLPEEIPKTLREPIGIISSENSVLNVPESIDELPSVKSTEHKTRALSAAEDDDTENPIKLVTGGFIAKNESDDADDAHNSKFVDENDKQVANENKGAQAYQQPGKTIKKSDSGQHVTNKVERPRVQTVLSDARVRHLRDQLIRARVYLGLGATRNNPHYIKELRVRMKEVQRALGDASKDSDLPRNANDKLKAMEQVLARGNQIQDDCAAVIKKLRAILHSTEEQLRYYSLNSDQRKFPNQEKLEDPSLFHYALFSDNILAAAVVVNSTVSHAKDPAKHVFHIVTDRLNYAAMRMWFLANLPSQATIQVQNIEEFTWLNASYSPVLKQLGSPSMIDYYFKADRAKSDSNLKFRNPKYLSILNHLRFYLPEIFPKLNKVLFVDDDIVVQKDLSGLWSIDLKGNVNGAVETCGESFHRFDRYLNFSNPLISKNFDPHACGWAYGMNIFDLDEWKKQNRTEVYHSWQRLNHDRQLWKLGTLPPGLITFWKSTFPLHRSWHVLGLGYNPSVGQKEIDRAAVIHYNGNMKPWLEIGMPKYRNYWARFINYEQAFLRDCNINP